MGDKRWAFHSLRKKVERLLSFLGYGASVKIPVDALFLVKTKEYIAISQRKMTNYVSVSALAQL